MPVSSKIYTALTNASWIRRMFEIGLALKKQYGADNVYDFSLGNPDLESPPEFTAALIEESKKTGPLVHGYMPNAGFVQTRQAIADMLTQESDIDFTADHVMMTVGAAGALNVLFKSILEPGEEVIVIAPFFAEYDFYIDNHQGVRVIAESTPDLLPDIGKIRSKITSKTRALLINSPNNPSGRVYDETVLRNLSTMLESASKKFGKPIYLIADGPYKKIIYDGLSCISPFLFYRNAILATSFSKDLSLAGERIGYLAVSPFADDDKDIINAATFCNRVLGYVNAPALMQRVIPHVLDAQVNVTIYQRRRDLLFSALTEIGYEVIKPQGTFYIFPKCPIDDDIRFVQALQEKLILTTPGTGFHRKGYFRIAFCVSEEIIRRAIPGFKAVFDQFK
ncbi:MAG: pyridoxal phosphate-dependent aminotransferase [Candidatus Neomarinimicrobiota bacterium]